MAAGCVAVSVGDTGVGMPPEVISRAFEPFLTTKEIGTGTGLGLTMVYGAVRQMGGEVTIQSEPGRGTPVRMLLPATGAPAAASSAAATPAPRAAAPREKPIILHVEDDPLVRMATVDLLASAGYTVCDAADAERALAILDEHRGVALMVTDVGLPGMNGRVLAAEARRRRPDLKVVFLTGYDRDKAGDARQRDPAVRYLDKPYPHAELFRAIEELLQGV